MGFTIGSMYWINPNYSLEEIRADMRRIRENRIKLLRIFILWEYVEVERNRFDFTLYDAFFHVAEEAGIQVMPTLIFYLPFHRIVEQVENGRSDEARRFPCLDRPEIREGLELFVSETVRRYKDSPALRIWNLWNEPTDPLCLCPHSLEKFALWLKQKYPTLEALQSAWAGEYYIFKPVLPNTLDELDAKWLARVFQLPLRGRDTAMRLDALEFQIHHSAEHLAFLQSLVRKYDAVHETHSNPATTAINPLYAGISPWELAKVQDSISGSIHPHGMFSPLEENPEEYPRAMLSAMDLIRSWADGKNAWIGEYQAGSTYAKTNAYTPRGADISSTLYHALARGLKGVVFWEWQAWRQSSFETAEFSLRNPSDGGPTERSEAVREFGVFLDKYQSCLSQLAPPHVEVAILHSMEQFADDIVLGRQSWLGGGHFQAAYAVHQSLVRAGISCDFVTESQLPDKLREYRVLFLPYVRVIAPKAAAAIANFIRNGGAVWADGRCGFLDRHHFLRGVVPGNGLDQVFGCRESDEVAPFAKDRLYRKDGFAVEPYREIQRLEVYEGAEVLAECNGYPAAVRNHLGKGSTELWGTYVTVGGKVELSKLILPFLASHGIRASIPIKSGKELLVSSIQGKQLLLVVFTSLAEEPQKVVAELPSPDGRVLNEPQVSLTGKELSFTIQPGETLPLLIQSNKHDGA